MVSSCPVPPLSMGPPGLEIPLWGWGQHLWGLRCIKEWTRKEFLWNLPASSTMAGSVPASATQTPFLTTEPVGNAKAPREEESAVGWEGSTVSS